MIQSQATRLYELLKDGRPVRTDEIMFRIYGNDHLGLARVGARIWDIKKKYGVEVKGWKDEENLSLYWYQLEPPQPKVQAPLFDLPPKSTAHLWTQ